VADSVSSHLNDSCFDALGPSAVRYYWSLAWLEQHQNAAACHLQRLGPLDDATLQRAQLRARCFRYNSAILGAAMRLSGTPSLPAPIPVPSARLARNRPGVTDFHPPAKFFVDSDLFSFLLP
jgi:hypothetical protein